MTDPETARRLSELAARVGHTPRRSWAGPEDFWPLLERMREEGAVVVVKLDGQRTGEDDTGAYTVVISGGPLGDDYVRAERDDIADALSEAVVEYGRAAWE
jgi:hypothetical protein